MRRISLLALLGLLLVVVGLAYAAPNQILLSHRSPTISLQSISSVTQFTSSTTFSAATANATVGIITVTMNPAMPAFSGSLSITGANSCGFHLSGVTVQAGTSGCSATGGPHSNGLYDDWSIVATQPNIPSFTQVEAATATATTGTISCDIGPSYTSTIPAPAQAAGFTHCVANYDFTQTGSFTSGGHTYQWSNLSSWLECAGATSPLLFKKDYGIASNCSDITMTTDSGIQVLQMVYTSSDTSGQTWLSTDSSSGYPNSAGVRTHSGFYVEENWRQTSASFNTCQSYMPGCIQFDFWNYQVASSCPGCADIEFDVVENYGNGSGGGNGSSEGVSHGSGFYTVNYQSISGYDRTQYNTFGAFNTVTNGGSPNYEACWVLNGVSRSSCGTGTVDQASLSGTTIEFYPMQVGPQAAGSDASKCSSQTCSPTGTLTAFVQRMTIWACSGYSGNTSGGPCYSTNLVSY